MKLAMRNNIAHRFWQALQARSAWITLPLLGLALLATLLFAISFGSVPIPLSTILPILLNGTGIFHFAPHWDSSFEVIIWQSRLPDILGTALVGAALAVAGVLFQAMLRNPLADPFLIGTSSGAALGAAISFVLPFDALVTGAAFPLTPLFAFFGAMITVFFVYFLARSGGETPVVTLILAGVVVNSVLTAVQTVLLTLAPATTQFRDLAALFSWLSGGVSVTDWQPVLVVGVIILPGIMLALGLAGILDAFGLGEESATYLGLHVERYKLFILALASLLTAAAVSISGLIGFVGLVTPHVMRLLLGPRHRLLLPASAFAGAIFLVLADLGARVLLAPSVLPDGVFTALVGAPFFLFLLKKSKRSYQW